MKIAIVYYSTYGHVATLAESIKQGIEKSGKASVDILQVPETLSPEILAKMHAPTKPAYKVASAATLPEYDAFVFGYPTRFGQLPAQMTDFLGTLGGLWASGALHGKPAALFTSTSSPGGGQEVTLRNFLSYIAHHGMVYVPLGYAKAFGQITSLDEVHGGTPYGALTFAGSDGSREVSALEKEIAFIQGESFADTAAKFVSVPAETIVSDKAAETAAETPAADIAKESAKEAPAAAADRSQKPAAAEKEKSGCCVIV